MKAEDREADAVNGDVTDEDINMDSKSEMHKSALNSKQGDPVMNGMEKPDSAPSHGKGELSV